MICTYCGYDNNDTHKYCSMCGAKLETVEKPVSGYIPIERNYETIIEEPVYEETKKGRNYFFSPVIWIVSILFLVICVGLELTISSYTITPTITYDSSYYDSQASLQGDGMICQGENSLYLAMEGYIYEYSYAMEEVQVIAYEYGENLHVVDNYLYFVDSNNDCQKINLDTLEKELVLENVYYVSIQDNIITYQHDSDNESIHQYNIDTQEDSKLNDEVSYMLTVVDNDIYYVDTSNNLWLLNDTKELITTEVTDFVVYEDELYIMIPTGIMIYTVDKELESEVVTTYPLDITFIDGRLYFSDIYGMLYGQLDDDTYEVIEQSGVTDLEGIGNILFYYNMSEGSYYVYDINGTKQVMYDGMLHSDYKEDEEIEWEGVEEF